MRRRTISGMAATAAIGLAIAATTGATAQAAGGAVQWSVHPEQIKAPFAGSKPAALPTPSQCLSDYGLACYTPTDIRSAYDIPDTVGGKPAGTGETIMIVDAYGSPTAQADLDTFSSTMGIPSTTLNIYTPEGAPDWSNPDTNEYGWAGETSLDVQWAHAVAPGAKIDLVVAPDNMESLDASMRWGISHLNPDTVSMSYGDPEFDWDNAAKQVYRQDSGSYAQAVRSGTTVFASAGDDWSDNGNGSENFASPADDANVVAVGGTNLNDGLDPNVPNETVWNDYDGCLYGCTNGSFGGTGGAPSIMTSKRGNDVSYDASVYTSVLVYEGFHADPSANSFYFTGGTSSSSPQWAALTADIDQAVGRRLGNIRPDLAGWAARGGLRDVTTGDNASATFSGGYAAGRGWDVPTGYGTPDVGKLIGLAGSNHRGFHGPHIDPAHRGRLHD
ncbi:MAG: S53 family peptidase [Nocardioidaceae bacterium]|nr:S53 family peptidase [Nocardioidaceae bacterium]MCL2614660.1 S53 family peptidase [Nocardioidaceae bacterium]